MTKIPQIIFLDTNVYLIGAVDIESTEGQILQWLGWDFPGNYECEVVISKELIDQISRVAKRLKNKDLGGEIIGRIWQNFKVRYVQVDDSALAITEAQCFVSANHKLIRILAQKTGEFECLTPLEFIYRVRF
jgi:hypothetical protein